MSFRRLSCVHSIPGAISGSLICQADQHQQRPSSFHSRIERVPETPTHPRPSNVLVHVSSSGRPTTQTSRYISCATWFWPSDKQLIREALDGDRVTNNIRLKALWLLLRSGEGKIAHWVLISAVLGVLVAAGPVLGMKLLGFSAAGIVKGSVAAALPSKLPLVAAGSWFAWAQSASATGAITAIGAKLWLWSGMAFLSSGLVYQGKRIFAMTDRQLLLTVAENGLVDEELRSMLHQPRSKM